MSASLDAQLIKRFRGGEATAFDALVLRHRQRVFRLVYRMTGDADWAEDITVEVFLEAYLSLPGFQQRSQFNTWLHRLAVNVCLEHIRHRKAKRYLTEEPLDSQHIASPGNPADAAMNRDLAQRITAAMQDLPECHRAAVVMYHLENLSCAEIAEILGISRNTVKTRIFYGTRVLRDLLRANGVLSDAG